MIDWLLRRLPDETGGTPHGRGGPCPPQDKCSEQRQPHHAPQHPTELTGVAGPAGGRQTTHGRLTDSGGKGREPEGGGEGVGERRDDRAAPPQHPSRTEGRKSGYASSHTSRRSTAEGNNVKQGASVTPELGSPRCRATLSRPLVPSSSSPPFASLRCFALPSVRLWPLLFTPLAGHSVRTKQTGRREKRTQAPPKTCRSGVILIEHGV
jgi:hypothetical protein